MPARNVFYDILYYQSQIKAFKHKNNDDKLSESESRGKVEGLNLAGEIIKRKLHGESPAAIACVLNIEPTEVLLITHLLD